jgi:type IV secretory pathway VirJ component
MFGSRMTIGIGATLWCLVCGGGAVAGPFVPAALAQASAAAEASGSGNAAGPWELASVRGLPVVEVPATGPAGGTLAVLLTGDGGWAAGDKAMAAELAGRGVGVVGWDIPSYLGVARTPDGAAADLQRLLEHYLGGWHKDRVILVGYSHGANVAPFMAARLPDELRGRIDLLALLGPANHASFRFHLSDIVADVQHDGDLPVRPELDRLRGVPMLCVHGAGESGSLCQTLAPSLARVETRPGGHRIPGGEGRAVADLILAAAR